MSEFCPPGFVRDDTENADGVEVFHRDGIAWNQAPIPPIDHLCTVQTDGWLFITHYHRCACGAHRFPGRSSRWSRLNSRIP